MWTLHSNLTVGVASLCSSITGIWHWPKEIKEISFGPRRKFDGLSGRVLSEWGAACIRCEINTYGHITNPLSGNAHAPRWPSSSWCVSTSTDTSSSRTRHSLWPGTYFHLNSNMAYFVCVCVQGQRFLMNPHNPCSLRCSSIRDLNVSLISGDLLLSIFIWVPMELKLGSRWSLWVMIPVLNFCGGHMRVNQLTICARNSMLRYGINGDINLFPSSQEPRPIEVLEKWEHYPVQEPRWQAQI